VEEVAGDSAILIFMIAGFGFVREPLFQTYDRINHLP
jgi:hypothetical protein